MNRPVHPRPAYLGCLALAAICACASPRAATAAPDRNRLAISDEELGDLRGGFLDANGLAFDFGARVRTFVNGALALQTELVWTPAGALSTTSLSDEVAGITGPAGATIGQALSDAAASAGFTTGAVVVQRVQNGLPQNFVFNAASNQNIRQEIDVTITMPISQQLSIAQDQMGIHIGSDADVSFIGALSH